MTKLIRPSLGLLQGCILYWLFNKTQLSQAGMVSLAIMLTSPLFAMQVKLPSIKTFVLGLSILIAMSLLYSYIFYYLLPLSASSIDGMMPAIIIQCVASMFIFFIFYCVAMEQRRLVFPYAALFSETWQVILKISLGKLLVLLTLGLFFLAGMLFDLLSISFIHNMVVSREFICIMPPVLFGISMTILHQYEEILTKLRNILLAFCQFLYPLFIIIGLSFLIVIPFANKAFTEYWKITILLSTINIVLFNGIFQAGFDKPPYSSWFCKLVYTYLMIIFGYSVYILHFPWNDIVTYGLKAAPVLFFIFLFILALYNSCYSLAIFCSKKPWLSMVKISNTVIALLTALLYMIMALPIFRQLLH